MRYALVNDERREAAPGLVGRCPGCSHLTVAKCGTQRIWHWAHRGNRTCDAWWEPETIWHRGWKNLFPPEWQEIIRHDESGEKHIADVMTERGQVIEFQHSYLPAQERESRERFYKKMIWLVNGLRLRNDRRRFFESGNLFRVPFSVDVFVTRNPERCMPSAWVSCTNPVLFDFEGFAPPYSAPDAPQGKLWCLLPGRIDGYAVVAAVSRTWFMDAARSKEQIIPTQAMEWFVRKSLSARRRSYTPDPNSRGGRRPRF